ncbi:hypothetical protein EG812_06120 [Verrucosispora sp. FIM060022]|nr:hypothetical protein EG812_06120 [Verrucosispora sp. FIM060022]
MGRRRGSVTSVGPANRQGVRVPCRGSRLDHRRRVGRRSAYVCGPPAMLAGSLLRLLAAGVPADRIHLPEQIPWR